MASTASHSIGTRTLRGMFWAYGSFVGVRLASFITTAVLARLLLPKDFGLIALAMTFMTFLETEAMNRRYREAEAVLLGHQAVSVGAP